MRHSRGFEKSTASRAEDHSSGKKFAPVSRSSRRLSGWMVADPAPVAVRRAVTPASGSVPAAHLLFFAKSAYA